MVDAPGHDSYLIKVDGSGRVTQRNRRFLRQFVPVSPTLSSPTPRNNRGSIHDPTTHHAGHPEVPPQPVPPMATGCDSTVAAPVTPEPVCQTYDPPPDESTLPQPGSTILSETSPRPRREIRAPRHYEPETGKWVDS